MAHRWAIKNKPTNRGLFRNTRPNIAKNSASIVNTVKLYTPIFSMILEALRSSNTFIIEPIIYSEDI
jgi:hypothetical protein